MEKKYGNLLYYLQWPNGLKYFSKAELDPHKISTDFTFTLSPLVINNFVP